MLHIVSLDKIHAGRTKSIEIFLLFDLLRNHCETNGFRKSCNRRDYLLIQAVFLQIVSISAIYFQKIDRQILQTGK